MEKRTASALFKNFLSCKHVSLMKLFLTVILLNCFQVFAHTYSQDPITLKLQSAEIKKALIAIEDNSSYRFLYDESVIANKSKISIDVKSEKVTSVLNQILENSGIGYQLMDNNLIILKRLTDNGINTNAEIRTAPASTIPNSRKSLPTNPSRKMMGRNTIASVIEVAITAK